MHLGHPNVTHKLQISHPDMQERILLLLTNYDQLIRIWGLTSGYLKLNLTGMNTNKN